MRPNTKTFQRPKTKFLETDLKTFYSNFFKTVAANFSKPNIFTTESKIFDATFFKGEYETIK